MSGKVDHRRVPEGEKQYDITRLWELHREIDRLLVASNGGYTNEFIAKQVGCTAQTVSNVRNSPMAKEHMAGLQLARDADAVSVAKRVQEIAPLAIELLESTMKNAKADIDEGAPDSKLLSQGVRASISVLDHALPKRTEAAIIHGHMTLEQIQEIKSRADGKRVEEAETAEVVEVSP